MPPTNVCWGIEVGAGAIKAIKLARSGDEVSVQDFAVIKHPRVLSTPDLDQTDALRVAVGALVNQKDLSKASIAISAPGHASFARFAKLPPVDKKRVPDIVKYEAVQQIPFPIEEVEWDYQTFGGDEDSPEVEVGIFALTRERVNERLSLWSDVDINLDVLSLSPVAVFNAIAYDRAFTEATPGTVILDIGATATDLIVAESGRVWVRTFPLGGHHFTEALVSAFKLPYSKAEKLKREAERSQHKRHIFQAMKPVFADLGQDVQRSLQYYHQSHPNAKLTRMIGVGSTFRLMGLRKFLSQQLSMEVTRLDRLERAPYEGKDESGFESSALNMATAYGLALQGVGLGAINANLIPLEVIRRGMWRQKTPWFAAAAVIGLAAGAVSFYRPILDEGPKVEQARSSDAVQTIESVARRGRQLVQDWKAVESKTEIGAAVENIESLLDRREYYAWIASDIGQMLAAADPDSGDARAVPIDQRRQFVVESLDVDYVTPSGGAPSALLAKGATRSAPSSTSRRKGGSLGGLTGAGGMPPPPSSREDREDRDSGGDRGLRADNGYFQITLTVESTNSEKQAFVDSTLLQWLRDHADREGAPYQFETSAVDQMIVSFTELGGDTGKDAERRGAPGSGGQDSRSSGGSSGFERAGERATTGGGGSPGRESAPSPVTGSLEQLAPVPPMSGAAPEDAKRYRYTIRWRAILKGDGASRGTAPPPSDRRRERGGR